MIRKGDHFGPTFMSFMEKKEGYFNFYREKKSHYLKKKKKTTILFPPPPHLGYCHAKNFIGVVDE